MTVQVTKAKGTASAKVEECKPRLLSRCNTVVQMSCITIAMMTASPTCSDVLVGRIPEELTRKLQEGILCATAVTTVASGVDYARTFSRNLRRIGSL